MSKPVEIIMPETSIDKDKLSEETKDALLSDAFRMDQEHATLEPAEAGPPGDHFAGDEHMLKPPGNGPETTELPLIRGKMLGEAQGMTPRLPLEKHASPTNVDSGLDDVPPMLRGK